VGPFVASSSSQQVGQCSPCTGVGSSSGFKAARYGFLVGRSRYSGLGVCEGKRWFQHIVSVKMRAA